MFEFEASVNVGGECLRCLAVGDSSKIVAKKCTNENGVDKLLTPLLRARTEALLFAIAHHRGLIGEHHA
jgi:hypothetical protein